MAPRGTQTARNIVGVIPGRAGRAIQNEVEEGIRSVAVGDLFAAARRENTQKNTPERRVGVEAQQLSIQQKKRNRIGGLQRGAMLAVAGFVDLIQLVLTFLIIGLIINTILSVVIFLIYVGWFSANGVNFVSLRRPHRHLLILLKLVPGFNAIPLWTFRIWSEIRLVRHEDREYNKKQAKSTAA